MPALTASSTAELQELLGARVNVANPLDYHLYIWGDYEQLNACFAKFLGNRFACTLLVLDYPPHEGADQSKWKITEQALIDAVKETGQRAVVVASLPETLPADVRQRLAAAGIAPMQGIEDCIFAARAAAEIGAAQKRATEIDAVLKCNGTTGDAQSLDEVSSKSALAEHGVTIPAGQICTADETAAAATAIGYPVVLKAVSSELAHKSEASAVVVGLGDAVAVHDATESMAINFDQFLVEAMAGPTVAELIVGVSRDATFGLSLLIGTGGTMVELLDDTVSLLLPASRDDIAAAIQSLKVARIIEGFRGGIAGDMNAVLDAVEAIVKYAVANSDRLLELDVNPLLVTPDAAIAVDAFIRIMLPVTKT
jgi:acetyl-CoA synthetase